MFFAVRTLLQFLMSIFICIYLWLEWKYCFWKKEKMDKINLLYLNIPWSSKWKLSTYSVIHTKNIDLIQFQPGSHSKLFMAGSINNSQFMLSSYYKKVYFLKKYIKHIYTCVTNLTNDEKSSINKIYNKQIRHPLTKKSG